MCMWNNSWPNWGLQPVFLSSNWPLLLFKRLSTVEGSSARKSWFESQLGYLPVSISPSLNYTSTIATVPKGVLQQREGCLTRLLKPAVCAKQAVTVHSSSVSFSDQYQPSVYVVPIPFQGLAMRLWQQPLMINTNHVHSLVHNRHHNHSIHMNGRLADFGI